MRLLSWNVAGRRTRLPEQAEAVVSAGADVVCLQEVTWNSLPEWRAALAGAGLACSTTPLDDGRPPKPRRLAVLTASRAPHDRIAIEGLPWPERAVHVVFADGVEVLNVHSPISPSPGLAKVLTHEALYAHVRDRRRIVLCGDLNTPRRDLPDGSVLTFAHESNGTLRPERGERWHAAEAALVHTLRAEHDWRDPFLDSGTAARTWTFKENRGGWRLDHVLVRDLEVGAHAYVHDWRLAGLSDHSAVLADVSPPAERP
jgi:exodeoxyribonuclease III